LSVFYIGSDIQTLAKRRLAMTGSKALTPDEHNIRSYLIYLRKSKNLRRLGLAEENRQLEKFCLHSTRSAPSFICSAFAVDLSNRDWKSGPSCSQAILMASFYWSATTMNFDGLSSFGCEM
jgi:hypothetical protein